MTRPTLISLLVLHVVDVDSHHVVRVVVGLPGTLGRRHPVPEREIKIKTRPKCPIVSKDWFFKVLMIHVF